MSDMPDLSKIVNLIMENPALIEEISALAKGEGKSNAEETAEPPTEMPANTQPSSAPIISKSEKRQRLLSAMKPYLKDERSRAIDSMLSVVEILDMVRSK